MNVPNLLEVVHNMLCACVVTKPSVYFDKVSEYTLSQEDTGI